MIRGGDFYAVWDENAGAWSTDEQTVIDIIDAAVSEELKIAKENNDEKCTAKYMWDSSTGLIDQWHKYCQKQMRDHYVALDEKIVFANDPVCKQDYSTKRLPYPLEKGEYPSWDALIGTLYSEEERHKIEWAIGSIVTGDAKTLQKFIVMYGAAGTGKSTILNVIQDLFDGYYTVFDAKALGSSKDQFALEPFAMNPLVAIQHDGDLSRIEDNTRLNSLVSHEKMVVNAKYTKLYAANFKCFLFMGTNKPVKITDGKSGLLRRLIDVHPTGDKIDGRTYKRLVKQVKFELGAIAYHCKEVYLEDPSYYDDYIPISMMGSSNDFYNFMIDNYHVFLKEDGTTLRSAWEMYKQYCEDAKVPHVLSKTNFKEELKNYFRDFSIKTVKEDGTKLSSYYSGFRVDIFNSDNKVPEEVDIPPKNWIELNEQASIFDSEFAESPAQYASNDEIPIKKWSDVRTKLKSLDTHKLHYVRPPENLIVVDFDLKNKKGEKDLDSNLHAASSWPRTYAETSKSGNGLHLHYLYTGDVSKLSSIYDENIEIKKFTGKSSLRRMLTLCNDIPIATISSGLPLKGDDKKVLDENVVQTEKGMRTTIRKCLCKEVYSNTTQNVHFIYDILEKAYKSGIHYDVRDLQNDIIAFAAQSTNQARHCLQLVNTMRFCSDEVSANVSDSSGEIIFLDCEVFPNLLLINWKFAGEDKEIVRMINPSPSDIEELMKYKIIGFYNRKYDNHILYARLIGYDNEKLFDLSQKLVTDGSGKFGEAYNLSYTDIYDFAAKKQSLKKWEIELGIHHQELGLPWDQPVPKKDWVRVAEYCDNDVIATEKLFNHLKGDFLAREILAALAGGSVNDTTNQLTTRLIFGKDKHPQLVYTDLATGERSDGTSDDSVIQAFPGYEFTYSSEDKAYHNMFRNTDLGFGGYAYSVPGVYVMVALLDIASLHPHSIKAMNCFGDKTSRYYDLLRARIYIKHKEFDKARTMLNGILAPYLDDESVAKNLAQALKIAINSVYGLTAANFDNPFRDPRNKNNIVALRGALFMRTLQDELADRGFSVCHIKTDSAKIPNATQEIIDFCMEFANKYGYSFEHEATYSKICLVDKANYIAKYADGVPKEYELPTGEKIMTAWTATGELFSVPYVFKTLFSHDDIKFDDLCVTFSVASALYLSDADKTCDVEQPKPENLQFIGHVGRFCPIKNGCGGKELIRSTNKTNPDGSVRYDSASGAKGYRWLEAEMVQMLGKEGDIDITYYTKLADNARDKVSAFCDFEWFVSDDPVANILEELPWKSACGKDTCIGCPDFINAINRIECRKGYDVSDYACMSEHSPFDVR